MTTNDTVRDSLTPKQRKALAAVLSEPTLAKAAESAGIAEVTLFRWLRDPIFRTALREAEDAVIDNAMHRLLHVQDRVIDTLLSTMTDTEASHAVRLRAAVHAFEFTLKVHSYRRMAHLEEIGASSASADDWLAAEDK